MNPIFIAALVLLLLWLLGQVRLGVAAAYGDAGFSLRLRVGAVSMRLFPKNARKKRATKGAPPPEKPVKPPARPDKKGDVLALIGELLPLATEAAGRFLRKVRIDQFYLDVVWAGEDPASTAVGYGRICAAVGALWPLVRQSCNVKEESVSVKADFGRTSPSAVLDAALSLTLGQLMTLGLVVGVKGFRILLTYRRKTHTKEKVTV